MKYSFILLFILLSCGYKQTRFDHGSIVQKSVSLDNDARLELIYKKFDIYKDEFPKAVNIKPDEAKSFIDPVIVDVREEKERKVSSLKNAISKAEFLENKAQYINRKILVYCTIGYRSGLFAQQLLEAGFDSYNLLGGVLLWSHYQYDFYQNDALTYNVHVYSRDWSYLHDSYRAQF